MGGLAADFSETIVCSNTQFSKKIACVFAEILPKGQDWKKIFSGTVIRRGRTEKNVENGDVQMTEKQIFADVKAILDEQGYPYRDSDLEGYLGGLLGVIGQKTPEKLAKLFVLWVRRKLDMRGLRRRPWHRPIPRD
jgi:hypothetical protein